MLRLLKLVSACFLQFTSTWYFDLMLMLLLPFLRFSCRLLLLAAAVHVTFIQFKLLIFRLACLPFIPHTPPFVSHSSSSATELTALVFPIVEFICIFYSYASNNTQNSKQNFDKSMTATTTTHNKNKLMKNTRAVRSSCCFGPKASKQEDWRHFSLPMTARHCPVLPCLALPCTAEMKHLVSRSPSLIAEPLKINSSSSSSSSSSSNEMGDILNRESSE